MFALPGLCLPGRLLRLYRSFPEQRAARLEATSLQFPIQTRGQYPRDRRRLQSRQRCAHFLRYDRKAVSHSSRKIRARCLLSYRTSTVRLASRSDRSPGRQCAPRRGSRLLSGTYGNGRHEDYRSGRRRGNEPRRIDTHPNALSCRCSLQGACIFFELISYGSPPIVEAHVLMALTGVR